MDGPSRGFEPAGTPGENPGESQGSGYYGQPQGYPQQQPYGPQPYQQAQTYPPQGYGVPPRRHGAPKNIWSILGIIGIIILIVGMFMVAIGQTTPPPQRYTYSSESMYDKALHGWYNATSSEIFFGKLIGSAGDALLGIMVIGLLMNPNMDREEKNMLIVATVLFILGMIAILVAPSANSLWGIGWYR